MNLVIFIALALFQLFRGSRKSPSIINMKPCSAADWSSFAAFVILCFLFSAHALKTLKREQHLKQTYGNGLVETDVRVSGRSLTRLLFGSFMGGWVSGALGLGGGSIFNPLLLSMGCPPTVASATGMYMIIFSTSASTISYAIGELLNWSYGLWIGSWCIVGTIIGMKTVKTVMAKLGRQSPLVILLTFVLGISGVAVVVFGIIPILKENQGNMWEYGSICY
jgi:uncharacterized membrane protein YfcA